MRSFFKTATIGGLFALPFMAFAVSTKLEDVFTKFGELISILTPVVVALALLAFFWGLAMYVLHFTGDDKDKKKGREMMVYGLVVLFVMISVWGIVNILQNTFGLQGSDTIKRANDIPSVQVPR